MTYSILKHIHMTAAFLTAALFFLRGSWMIFSPRLLQRRWVKIVPHVIDTVLLVSALALVYQLLQFGAGVTWVWAKVLGVVVYIALGLVALKRGRTLPIRMAALAGGLLTLVYIFSVAYAKSAWPW